MCKRNFAVIVFLLVFMTGCDTGVLFPVTASLTPPTGTPIPPPKALGIVYIGADGNVWLWSQENSTQLTTSGGVRGVRISENGSYVAYVDGDGSLSVLDRENPASLPRLLISTPYLIGLTVSADTIPWIEHFYFIPNHDAIMLDIKVTEGSGGEDIFKVFVTDSNPPPVRMLAPGEGGEMHFSPDGNWFVLGMPNELILSSTDGSKTTSLFDYFPVYLGLGARGGPDIVWKEDSTAFYTITPTYRDNTLFGTSTVWQISVADPTPESRFTYVAQLYHSAYLSPRGEHVLHIIDYGDQVDYRIEDANGEMTFITYPKDHIGFLGWAPVSPASTDDSNCFTYWQEDPQKPRLACIGDVVSDSTNNPLLSPCLFQWVNESQLLYVTNGNILILRSNDPANNSGSEQIISPILVTKDLPAFDFTK